MSLGWLGIVRLGLVQTALGAIVVLTTSTINRVMTVELSLAAMVPGLLVAWHYALQFLRPRWGHGSDGGHRTPWIIGGMAVLAVGGVLAAVSVQVLTQDWWAGIAAAGFAFTLIGFGVGASGTSLLALLAQSVDPGRRAAAATIVWIMMILGFIVTTALAGRNLDPFSPERLIAVASVVCMAALALATFAVWGVEARVAMNREPSVARQKPPFKQAFAEVWADAAARRFAVFVFVSMIAYSMQDLVLEPFAGSVFGMTVGETTNLSSVQSQGVLIGMLLVGAAATRRPGGLRGWVIAGCIASGLALLALAAAAAVGQGFPLKAAVWALGFANGVYAVAAIGAMFNLAAESRDRREGVRMGLFGAAQAVAFGLGNFAGTAILDAGRHLGMGLPTAYGAVFAIEAGFFALAAVIALGIGGARQAGSGNPLLNAGERQFGA